MFWQTSVHDGVIADTQTAPRSVQWRGDWQRHLNDGTHAGDAGYELVLQADPTIYDGRFANNGWLQECPKPLTTLTWDNAALMSPATAQELGVGLGSYAHGGEHGGYHPDVVELQLGERTVRGAGLDHARTRRRLHHAFTLAMAGTTPDASAAPATGASASTHIRCGLPSARGSRPASRCARRAAASSSRVRSSIT